MKPFKTIKSIVTPLPLKDIDTDTIIPAQFLKNTTKNDYGKYLFYRSRKANKKFPLNLPKYKNSKILITESNFGCGSSREHAVWAILDYGIRAIIAPSFSDIFKNNSEKNGLLLITFEENIINNLIQQAESQDLTLSIDLKNQEIKTSNKEEYYFLYDSFRKECLINGYDDIDYIQKHLKY